MRVGNILYILLKAIEHHKKKTPSQMSNFLHILILKNT